MTEQEHTCSRDEAQAGPAIARVLLHQAYLGARTIDEDRRYVLAAGACERRLIMLSIPNTPCTGWQMGERTRSWRLGVDCPAHAGLPVAKTLQVGPWACTKQSSIGESLDSIDAVLLFTALGIETCSQLACAAAEKLCTLSVSQF